ncbi:MAG TPA: ABC transporter substrate-binding protein [Stellaceae bacterium]|nr:ABC transporter substrate-binding protein [Stellaceae bacterium]
MRRIWAGAVVAVLLVLAISRASAAEKVAIGVLRLASSGPIFVAVDKGYFAAEGLDAQLKFFDAAQPVAVATVSGDIDIGVTGLTGGFYNLAGKGALRIIAAQSREEPHYRLNAYLVSNQAYAAGLTSLAALADHSVGITQVGSTFHYCVGLIAEKLQIPLASIRLVPLQSLANMASAIKGGQVDAVIMPATAAEPLLASGSVKLLGWVGDETPWQLGAIFTTEHSIAERRPMLEAAIRAYQKGAHDFYDAFLKKGPGGMPVDGPTAPEILAILAKYTGLTPEHVRPGIPYVDPDGRLLVRDIYHQVQWYQSQGLVDQDVDAKAILDLSFVQGHYDVPQ